MVILVSGRGIPRTEQVGVSGTRWEALHLPREGMLGVCIKGQAVGREDLESRGVRYFRNSAHGQFWGLWGGALAGWAEVSGLGSGRLHRVQTQGSRTDLGYLQVRHNASEVFGTIIQQCKHGTPERSLALEIKAGQVAAENSDQQEARSWPRTGFQPPGRNRNPQGRVSTLSWGCWDAVLCFQGVVEAQGGIIGALEVKDVAETESPAKAMS